MKISEKQIINLMQLVQYFSQETQNNLILKRVGDHAAYLLDEIRNQQSDELKEVK